MFVTALCNKVLLSITEAFKRHERSRSMHLGQVSWLIIGVRKSKPSFMDWFTHIFNKVRSLKRLVHINGWIVVVANLIRPSLSDNLHVLAALNHYVWTVIDSLITKLEGSLIILSVDSFLAWTLVIIVLFDMHVRWFCVAEYVSLHVHAIDRRFISRSHCTVDRVHHFNVWITILVQYTDAFETSNRAHLLVQYADAFKSFNWANLGRVLQHSEMNRVSCIECLSHWWTVDFELLLLGPLKVRLRICPRCGSELLLSESRILISLLLVSIFPD